ncbi:MAG: CPBP family intramembrane glutamic endopeptidase, partial [Luteolibacter sp.]
FAQSDRQFSTKRPKQRPIVALKRFWKSELGAVLLWLAASFTLAAALAPWAYRWGKGFAAEAGLRNLPGWLESVAGSCGRAELDRYFDRSLLFAALVLLPFLLRRIRRISRDVSRLEAWKFDYPLKTVVFQLSLGMLVSGGLLVLTALVLVLLGAGELSASLPDAARFIRKAVIPAIAASLIEEWLFRGILLGLWLRFARPATALLGSSLLFAFLHFLQPPPGHEIAAPDSWAAGFQLLEGILLHFINPRFVVLDFSVLLLVGMILAWARIRTGALWFSIGLHAGWVFVFKASSMLFSPILSHPLHPWWMGSSLRSGLISLLVLGLTWLLSIRVVRGLGSKCSS